MSKMTPQDYLKAKTTQKAQEWEKHPKVVTLDNWEEYYNEDSDWYYDALSEVRCSGIDTGLTVSNYSRHYESKEVAVKCFDRWVGFTYWYGGGKHGEPEAMPWLEEAYFLDVKEEEVVTIKRTFTKVSK